MTRLSSYSRYFSTATPMQTGRAAVPRITTAPTTAWSPQPGTSPTASGATNTPTISDGHEDGRAAVEPLQLLAVLAARVPVGRYLDGQPGRPAGQGPRDHHHVQDTQRSGHRAGQVAAGLEADMTCPAATSTPRLEVARPTSSQPAAPTAVNLETSRDRYGTCP